MIEMQRWESYKKNIMRNLEIEKTNRRYDFDRRLRKELKVPRKLSQVGDDGAFDSTNMPPKKKGKGRAITNSYLTSVDFFMNK